MWTKAFCFSALCLVQAKTSWAQTEPPAASFPVEETPAQRPPPSVYVPPPAAQPEPPAPDTASTAPGASEDDAGNDSSAIVSEAQPAPIQKLGPPRVLGPRPCAEDNDAVFRAFSRFADTQKRTRIAGVVSGVIVGAFTIGAGAAVANYFDVPAEPFYVLGGIAMVLPLLGLVTTSNAESYATRVRADVPGHSAEEALSLRQTWAGFADKARTQRYVESGLGMAVGIASFAFGIAILDGAFSMTENDRGFVGTLLVSMGGAATAGSVTGFFVKSPMEASYEQFEAARSSEAPRFSVSTGPSHAQLNLRLAF